MVVPNRQSRPVGGQRGIGNDLAELQVHSLKFDAQLYDVIDKLLRILWSGYIIDDPVFGNAEFTNLWQLGSSLGLRGGGRGRGLRLTEKA